MTTPVQLRTGARLRSQVDATEVIVVRAPSREVNLTCGGAPMIAVIRPEDSMRTVAPSNGPSPTPSTATETPMPRSAPSARRLACSSRWCA